MYHMIIVATALLIQYLFVHCTIGFFYRFYRKYEIDLKNQEEAIVPNNAVFGKNDIHRGIEYTKLMIDDDN